MGLVLQIAANGLLLGGWYALLAVGLTLIFGVLRVVNFAHAEFMMLGMYGAYWLRVGFGLDPYVSVFLVTPVIFLLGTLVDRAVIRRSIGKPDVTVVFATLGLSILLQNAVLAACAGSVYAAFIQYIDPGSTTRFELSVQIALVAIVGGMHTPLGPLLGAAIVIPLGEMLRARVGGGAALVVYGFLLIVIVLAAPNGAIEIVRRIVRRRLRTAASRGRPDA